MAATSRAKTRPPATPPVTPPPTAARQKAQPRRRAAAPLKIADRYLLGYAIESTLRGLGWFAGLLMCFAIITAMRKVVENSLSFADTCQLIAYQMPRILLFTLPMSVLYGTVQTFAELSSKGEVTALSAGGMSLPRMIVAPLGWGVLLGVIAFWLQEWVVPQAETQKTQVLARQLTDALAVQENFSFEDKGPGGTVQRKVQAARFDPKSKMLIAPVIQIFNEDGSVSIQIKADRAVWNPATGKWRSYQTKTTTFPQDGGTFSSESTAEVTEIDAAPDPKMMGKKALTRQQNLEAANFEMVSIFDLSKWRSQLRRRPDVDSRPIQKKIRSATFGIHDKIATPLICVALILVGAPLGVRPQRSSGGFAMGLSLAVLLLYYLVWTWASQLGKYGAANPYLMAYLSLVLTLSIGATLLRLKTQ